MRVVVVGAGLAGLVCARRLVDAGHDVVLFDKGRSVGGRLATRRIAGGVVDHGAQFFTVRSEAFAAVVDGWRAAGLVREWHRGLGGSPDGHPRYVCPRGMNALGKHLAAGLSVRAGSLVFAIRPGSPPDPWVVTTDDGVGTPADAVVVTCPVPQTLSLVIDAGVEVPDPLRTLDYDRTLALLAVLDRPPAVPGPGAVQDGDPVFSFIADNQAKGVSPVPAVTLHASPAWSLAAWDREPAEVLADLTAAARPWLGGARIVEAQVKRWRFATPQHVWPAPSLRLDGPGGAPLVLAGDAFGGPRVEGAACSGLAAAEDVSRLAAQPRPRASMRA